MSDPRTGASDGDGKENSVAKTAGLVVFSGIAMSILKALNPLNRDKNETLLSTESNQSTQTQPAQISQPVPPPQLLIKKPIACTETEQKASEAQALPHRTIQIVKGDTLWGLSKKYGVSIDAIKEANGLTGNTIYAGKKLIIP